jgi:hypothetical protein
MSDSTKARSAIDRTLQIVDGELAGVDASPFSPPAFDTLKQKVADYIRALIDESAKIAKRHDAETISETYVEDANRVLVSASGRRWFRHLGTVGGILLGASLSNMLSMITTQKFSAAPVLATMSLGIIGAFMVALHIAKD